MASVERENFGERNGKRIRNVGVALTVVSFVAAPPLLAPSVGLAIGGEALNRVSKNENESR